MPKSFSKVHKKISKKRGQVEALHENSRDAKRLHRANHRDERVARVTATTSRGRHSYRMILLFVCYSLWKHLADLLLVDRVITIQESIPEGSGPFSDEDIRELVTRYVYTYISLDLSPVSSPGIPVDQSRLYRHINRSVPEIEQLQHERRKGRPPSKREEALLQRTEAENKELKTGFWMPDLSDEGVIKTLPRWNRDWSALSMMKFIRFTADGGKQPSAFPPKGLS